MMSAYRCLLFDQTHNLDKTIVILRSDKKDSTICIIHYLILSNFLVASPLDVIFERLKI